MSFGSLGFMGVYKRHPRGGGEGRRGGACRGPHVWIVYNVTSTICGSEYHRPGGSHSAVTLKRKPI